MKLGILFGMVFIAAIPWVWNAVKFVRCDFDAPVKCEVIHGIGVFMPPAAYITVWFDDDSVGD